MSFIIPWWIIVLSIMRVEAHENNACSDFSSYLDMKNSPDCFYDPDATLTSPQLIEKYTGKVEIHKATTEDGYILTMFRMARKNRPKGVVLLQHPLISHSRIFLGQGKESLGFLLWKDGYDVWLNNMRGTQYSQEHVNLTTYNLKYWDFSFHEIGLYDISSQIALIRQHTNISDDANKIIFIGYSLGTTTGLIYSSEKAMEAQQYVKIFVYIATSAFYKYATSPIYLFSNYLPEITNAISFLGLGMGIPFFPLIKQLARFLLKMFPFLLPTILALNSIGTGGLPLATDPALFNTEVIHYIDNFSWKIILHYLQLKTNSHFQWFDYGPNRNMKYYGKSEPDEYPVEKINVPTYLISSSNDSITAMKDAWDLYEMLPQVAKKYGKLDISGLNHINYMFAKDRKQIVLNKLIEIVNKAAGER